MKKSIFISVFALLFSVASFAQGVDKKQFQFKAPSAKEIAQRRADMMRKQCDLDAYQYDKIYKLYLKQAKKDAARMEQMKKEREQMEKQLKGILNKSQWEKYQKMLKRQANGKQIRRPSKPAQPGRPIPQPFKQGDMKKGPKVEQPQNKKNNMYLEQK